MKTALLHASVAATALATIAPCVQSAEISPDFQFTHRANGSLMQRSDFEGKIVMLDFFAYWCPPCVTSSPSIESDIAKYYRSRGGNLHGVEVVVIGVNVEENNSAQTDTFIANSALSLVVDDFGAHGGAWASFDQGYIPHFVIINGTAGGSHQQWEVLHSDHGFKGAAFYRNLIDSIKSAEAMAPKIVVRAGRANLRDGSKKNFGRAKVRSRTSVQRFIIRNAGGGNLTQIRISRSGQHGRDFSFKKPRATLRPDESDSFDVRFSPKAKGKRSASISISSNDSHSSPLNITLIGRGVRR